MVGVAVRSGARPRRTFTDIRFAAGLLFAGAALFAAIDLAPTTSTGSGAHPHAEGPATPGGAVTPTTPGTTAPVTPVPVIAGAGGSAPARQRGTGGLLGSAFGVGALRGTSSSGGLAANGAGVSRGGSGATPVTTGRPTTTTTTRPPTSTTGNPVPPTFAFPSAPTTSTTTIPTSTTTIPTSTTTIPTSTTTTTPPPPPTPSAKALLQGALATVKGYPSTDSHVKNAIADLQTALASTAWSADGSRLTSTGGSVFDAMKKAVGDLAGTPSPPSSWNIVGVEAAVTGAARQLAAETIAVNACTPSKPSQLFAAITALDAGDAQAASGHFATAVGDYKTAWSDALAAAGTTC